MNENKLKSTIKQGGTAMGMWVALTDASVVEMVGLAGYDFAAIDIEHASLDYQTAENMFRSAERAGVTPIVRVGTNAENPILRVMEAGAQGVIVPHVMDGDSARRAVEYTKYEPLGIRGISTMTRAARWGNVDLAEHTRSANDQTMVIPMVEDKEGIDNIEDILATEGVDLVLLGPADLARSYGVTSENNPAVVAEAIEHAAGVAKRMGKPLGCSILHKAFNRGYREFADLGIRFIMCSTDAGVLMKGLRETLHRVSSS